MKGCIRGSKKTVRKKLIAYKKCMNSNLRLITRNSAVAGAGATRKGKTAKNGHRRNWETIVDEFTWGNYVGGGSGMEDRAGPDMRKASLGKTLCKENKKAKRLLSREEPAQPEKAKRSKRRIPSKVRVQKWNFGGGLGFYWKGKKRQSQRLRRRG